MSADQSNQEQNIADSDGQQSHSQDKFDEQVELLIDNFGAHCESLQINAAVVIAQLPNKDDPLVFTRGDLLSTTEMVAAVYRALRRQIMQRIDG